MNFLHYLDQFFRPIFRPQNPSLWLEIMRPIHELLGYISNHKIAGHIPMDIVAHLIISALFLHLGLNLHFKYWKILLSLFLIELSKEYFDSFRIGGQPRQEQIKDILVTFIYPLSWGLKNKFNDFIRSRALRQ